jgi:hypothetical protein
MSPEEVKSYFDAANGNPVSISLSDGRVFEVFHRDYILFHPVGNGMFLFNDVGGYVVLNRKEITSLEMQTKP